MNIGGADRAPRDENDPPRPPLKAVPPAAGPAPGSGAPASGPPRLTPIAGGGAPSSNPPSGPPRLTPVPPRPAETQSAGPPRGGPPGRETASGPPRLDAASATPLGPAWLTNATGAPVRSHGTPVAPSPPEPRATAETPRASVTPLPATAATPMPVPSVPAAGVRLAVVRGGASQLAGLIWRKLEERRAAIGSNRVRVSRSTLIASGLFLALFLVLLVVIPVEYRAPIEVAMPEPTRTVILEPLPEPPREAPRLMETAPVMVPDVQAVASNEKLSEPPRVRKRAVDPDAGKAGRDRAKKATADLAGATAALDKALGDLSSSLGASGGEVVSTRRARRRDVRGGRSDGELAGLEAGLKGSAGADVGGSAVEGKLVALGTLGASSASATEDAGGSSGAAPGVYRSNASLLAVIQKYAPGIQYCYETELKRDPGKRGKLVVSMTVSPEGRVVQASVVQNTVGSERLASCALSQIRDWKFPAIAGGLTTFQAPFLFTPPE